ncbi:MAG TPA: hypothetical protein PK821_04015, partial [Victivallales bacterium]|nr:hypothetical protein [Victivallales bacterium]
MHKPLQMISKFAFAMLLCVAVSIPSFAADKSDKKSDKKEKKEKAAKKDTKVKEGKPQYGAIVFPRKGSIDFEQGTFEIWFKPTYTTSESMFGSDSIRRTIVFMSAGVDEKFKRKELKKDKSAADNTSF